MNFLYDLTASQPMGEHEFHGGGKYAKHIFLALASKNRNDHKIFGLYNSAKPLEQEIIDVANSCSIPLIDIKVQTVKDIIDKFGITRFYSALPFSHSYDFLELLRSDIEVFGTIHGLRSLELPINMDAITLSNTIKDKVKFLLKISFKSFFKKRDHKYFEKLLAGLNVITVSNHTKYSIMSYFPNVENSVPVFYSPDTTGPAVDIDQTEDQTNEESNYFLLSGGSRWLKNNLRTIIALDNLLTERKYMSQNVILVGVKKPKAYLDRIKNKNRFTFLEYVKEEHLQKLYKNAYAFIYMSLNEGFGYPPLEAMRWKTPVIASPYTSIPEICGEAVLYSNPYSIDEIKSRVLQLEDKEVYSSLIANGLRRYEEIKFRQKNDLNNIVEYLLNKK